MTRPSWARRGTWRVGQINGALLIVQVVTLLSCLARGLDYLRPDTDKDTVLSQVQDTRSFVALAALFVAAAGLALVGFAGRWGRVIAVGHILAMAAYASVAWGLLWVTGLGPGVRTPIGLAGAAVIHGALGFGILAILRRREMITEPPGGDRR